MAQYTRITLAELQDRLEERVGNNVSFWDEEEARLAINEAIKFWQALVGEWNKPIFVSASGASVYDVPKQVVSLFRVGWVSDINSFAKPVPLSLTSEWELDHGFTTWSTTPGDPQLWSKQGLGKIAVYPQPSTGYLVLDGFAEAPVLISVSDFIDVGDEQITWLLDYGQWYLSFKEGVGEGTQNSQRLLNQLMKGAASRNRQLLASNLFRRYMYEARDQWQRPPREPMRSEG